MKYIDLPIGTVLYTGSRRIFAIQCYLEQHRWVWERYLKRLRYSRNIKDIDDSTWDRINKIIVQYNRQMDMINTEQSPWGPAVVFVAILEQLAFRFKYDVSVAVVLQELFRHQGWPLGGLELMRYAEGIENKTISLDAEFYSVMRQAVQFYGSLETASEYSQYVYKYTIEQPLRIVDISDRETSRELLATIFASWEPYTGDEIKYYCGPSEDIENIRDGVIHYLKQRFKGGEMKLLELFDKYYHKLPMPIHNTNSSWLAVRWSELYQYELCSPRGLWIASQLGILEGLDDRRYDGYTSDSLIVKTFTTGTGLDGWYNNLPQEWMIYHPEYYGMQAPLHDYPFTGKYCEFNLPSRRRHVEPEPAENPNAIEPEILIAEGPDY